MSTGAPVHLDSNLPPPKKNKNCAPRKRISGSSVEPSLQTGINDLSKGNRGSSSVWKLYGCVEQNACQMIWGKIFGGDDDDDQIDDNICSWDDVYSLVCW